MKNTLRKEALKRRESLSADEIMSKSSVIIHSFRGTDFYKSSKNVMIYVSFRNEVDTLELIDDMLKEGKRVFIPLTVSKTKELLVSEIIDIQEDLEIGNFGVLEPKKEKQRIVNPEILDLIVVPGVCFDKRGFRIGYGAGYYDRFLSKLPQIPTISLVFQLQLMDKVPEDSYDIPVDYIITENDYINCREELGH